MHVSEDDVVGVDAEALGHVDERRDTRDLRLQAQKTRVDSCQFRPQQPPGRLRHRRGPRHHPKSVGRPSQRLRQGAGDCLVRASQRATTGRLVVDRPRHLVWHPAQLSARDAERPRRYEVPVEIVTMGGPDPFGEPHTRIPRAHLGRRQPRAYERRARAWRPAAPSCRPRAARPSSVSTERRSADRGFRERGSLPGLAPAAVRVRAVPVRPPPERPPGCALRARPQSPSRTSRSTSSKGIEQDGERRAGASGHPVGCACRGASRRSPACAFGRRSNRPSGSRLTTSPPAPCADRASP